MSKTTAMNLMDMLNPEVQNEMLKGAQGHEEKQQQQNGWNEEEFYRLTKVDDKDNVAKVWFLPSKHVQIVEDEEGNEKTIRHDIVKYFRHKFEVGNQKVNIVCARKTDHALTGKWETDCELCSYIKENFPYSSEWKKQDCADPNKKTYNSLKAKRTGTWVNVYVEYDRLNPQYNGQVYKFYIPWKIEAAIVDKISGILDESVEQPKEGEKIYLKPPENIFQYPNSRPMLLTTGKDGQWDIVKGEWQDREDFMGGDTKKILEIFDKTYDLYEDLLKPAIEKYKSGDEINAILDTVYGTNRTEQKAETDNYNDQLKKEIEKQTEEATTDDIPMMGCDSEPTSEPVQKEPESKPTEDFGDEIPEFDPSKFMGE